MNHILNQISYSDCTGCFLCHDVCNKNAIKISLDKNGFYKPVVDEKVCIDCGLCTKKCPAINDQRISENFTPLAFAAYNANVSELRESSSGGIAHILGRHIIESGGVVYGARWDNGSVIFEKADSLESLEHFKGSKYLQPNANGIYNDVKSSIKSGKLVLFIGLPCHIRAIKNYISSENLITIDLLCAGVPSNLLWSKYCNWKFGTKNITSANFRSKDIGWRSSIIKIYSEDKELLAEVNYKNRFFLGFNSALFFNDACYNCKFNTIPRLGDITLGDYWGASASLDNKDGISLVLVNTKSGLILMKALESLKVIIKQINIEDAISGNYRINNDHRDIPKDRFDAFQMLRDSKFKKCSDKYFKPTTLIQKIKTKLKKYL